MSKAKNILEELSSEPELRRLAQERQTAILMHQHLLAASRDVGREEGEAKGRAEGETAMRQTIRTLAQILGIEPSPAQLARLEKLNLDELSAQAQLLATERRWPE